MRPLRASVRARRHQVCAPFSLRKGLAGKAFAAQLPKHIRRLCNPLTVNAFPICRLLASKRWPFTLQKTAFRNAKNHLLRFIHSLFGWFLRVLPVHILPQSRQSVTVMPHSDAASRVHSLYRLISRMFTGCRIKVPLDLPVEK